MEELKPYKYEVSFKREAVKGTDGFTVRANDDDSEKALETAKFLYWEAMEFSMVRLTKIDPPIS